MAYLEAVKYINDGVESWNEWKRANIGLGTRVSLDGIDLHRADLRGADLEDVDLKHAHLFHTDLRFANLRDADLRSSNLDNVKLNGSNLRNACLNGTNLSSADLSNANLYGAQFCEAVLHNTQLNNANLSRIDLFHTVLSNLDFRTTKGIAEIHHIGPSSVALYTIQFPPDGSALHFLRGAGVPDEWISDYLARMMSPVQYHSLFISYSSKDEAPARRLHADLQASSVRCWFAPEDLKIGNKFRQRIDEAIHLQDKLLLLLSEHSIASTWVESEVEAALEKEDWQKREVLFPVRLDDAVMQTIHAWVAKLRRTRHIGDFTCWMNPQAYQRAFQRLLRDLKQAKQKY